MNILVFNCGSSTLKFKLFRMTAADILETLASGIVDKIAGASRVDFVCGDIHFEEQKAVADHSEAGKIVLNWLRAQNLLNQSESLAVGHRVIHGGDCFSEPVLIDDSVIAAVDALSELAPLHNQPSLQAIRAARAVLGLETPMVAVFDTAFHHRMPEYASRYALPQDLADRHRIKRYGFHGLAHRFMMEHYASMVNKPPAQVKVITLQLGNGCSASAVAGGHSIDTSMGFTPLEGLMMGTRSGDIDPSLPGFIARREGASIEAVEKWLNTRSGLLGVSGSSKDMRELLAAAGQGDAKANLAIDMFCYRVKKTIGAYLAVLRGAEAVIFGGGIGENAPEIRARILSGLEWCGLKLDSERNASAIGRERRITTDDSPVQAYVIPVDEAIIIARDTVALLKKRPGEVSNESVQW